MAHTKLNYIHIFRAIAIIIIVAGHCFDCSQQAINSFSNVLFQDGTVLFVFIAGFLFEYLSDDFSYGSYLKKKFLNIVCPYLVTSVIGIVCIFLTPWLNPFLGINKILQTMMFLTTGYVHNLPTWYIPMICVFFLFAAPLLKLEKKLIFHKYPLLFVMLPVFLVFSCFLLRYETNFFTTEDMSAWQVYVGYLRLTAHNIILFFPIYILGMFFAKFKSYIQTLYTKRFWLIGLLIISSIFCFLFIYHATLPGRWLFPKIIFTLLILGYLEHHDSQIMEHSRLNNALGTVATYSFSIFFLHYYFDMAFYWRIASPLGWNTYLSAENFHFLYWILSKGAQFIFSFFGSLLTAILIKKILEKLGITHTRYFIGS